MNNKLLISGVLGLGTCMIYTPIHAGEAQAQSKPNVLIIYTDDMGAGDVSFLNNGWVKTPNIDKLASDGMIFTNHYSGFFLTGEFAFSCWVDNRTVSY